MDPELIQKMSFLCSALMLLVLMVWWNLLGDWHGKSKHAFGKTGARMALTMVTWFHNTTRSNRLRVVVRIRLRIYSV